MKILLDENIDVNFRKELSGYNVETVKSMGWSGISNSALLGQAVEKNFEVFITLDSNLKFQQDLSKFNIHIINLKPKDSRLTTLKLMAPEIIKYLNSIAAKRADRFIEITQ